MNNNTLSSLKNLSLDSAKVCISGEGDPLVAWKSLIEILKHGPSKTKYELITSSFWGKSKTEKLLQDLSEICQLNESSLAYRISIDQFHAIEIQHDVLDMLISIFEEKRFQRVELQIRSITGQEVYLFDRLHRLLTSKNIIYAVSNTNEIEYELVAGNFSIQLQFKPTVFPGNFRYEDEWSIDRYIAFLEENRNTNFHIGLLNDSLSSPAFDITINPNGTVVLYGAEPFILGNVTKEIFTYDLLKQRVFGNHELSSLISTKFSDLINLWRRDYTKFDLIKRVNNPFWVVRNLYKEDLPSNFT